VVVESHFPHDALPLVDEPRSLEASPRPLEVGERGGVVLALLRVDDAHALRTPQACSHIWMSLLEPLGGRLGGEVA
jgi:hypothetical protein